MNRYPGCQCDIPSHNYAYSFAPNPGWKNYYATSKEIYNYMKSVAKQYDCEKYISYSHRVCSARWVEDSGVWILTGENSAGVFRAECNILINAGGVLRYQLSCNCAYS